MNPTARKTKSNWCRIAFPRTPQQATRILLGSAGLLCALPMVSCQSTASNPPTPAVVAAVPQHWKQVSSDPPTFYPRGTAADCPTDGGSGEWVATGDAQGRRFFIPFHDHGSISRQTLVSEALSARSPQKVSQIAAENREFKVKTIAANTVMTPVWLLLGIAEAYGHRY